MKSTRLALLAPIVIIGCAFGAQTPGSTIKGFLAACNDGNVRKAETFVTAEDVALAKSQNSVMKAHPLPGNYPVTGFGVDTYCKDQTRARTYSSVAILRDSIFADTATVRFTIHYKDGSVKQDSETVFRSKGKWQIGTTADVRALMRQSMDLWSKMPGHFEKD